MNDDPCPVFRELCTQQGSFRNQRRLFRRRRSQNNQKLRRWYCDLGVGPAVYIGETVEGNTYVCTLYLSSRATAVIDIDTLYMITDSVCLQVGPLH